MNFLILNKQKNAVVCKMCKTQYKFQELYLVVTYCCEENHA